MSSKNKKIHRSSNHPSIRDGLGYQKTVLENGIKVITEEIPYLKSVSIIERLAPHTVAMEEEPFDSNTSETIRMV